MNPLFGLFLGVFIGVWAGPVGAVFPLVAFLRGLPYRWGALVGYVIGLAIAMYLYASLDSIVFREPAYHEEDVHYEVTPAPVAVQPVEPAPTVRRDPGDGVTPAWMIAIIPGALLATLGMAGAGWILMTSPDDELSDRH